MTESGDLVGTPLYMSPEQIIGDSTGIDARSDVWGLGATLYELLIGRPPFSGGSAQSILHAILHRDPALLRRQRPDVPRDLEAVVLKCLEKDRTRRYTGAESLHADLLALQAGRSVSARPPRFVDPALRWSRRHPYQAAGLVIGLCAFGFFASAMRAEKAKSNTAQIKRQEAEATRDLAREEKMLALARSELLKANQEWGNSNDASIQLQALDRVGQLMQAIPVEEYPQISAEIMRVYASFAKKRGLESTLTALYPAFGANVTPVTLMMRAAMLEGLEYFDEALLVHKQRAVLSPRAPEPWLDAGNSLRQLALLARAGNALEPPNDRLARRYFLEAIAMHDRALVLAVRSRNENTTATVLIERARCLIKIGERSRAERNLQDALARDPARADALGLLQACKEDPDARFIEPEVDSAPTPAPGPTEGALATRTADPAAKPAASNNASASKGLLGLPIVNRLPMALDLNKQDLTKAGKNLTSIYRGLRDVLRTAANAPAATGSSGSTAPASTPTQQ